MIHESWICIVRYLRPRKLETDTEPKKTYKSTKPSVLTQTRRMFLSNSRPNFVDSRSSRRWRLTTEAVLGGLLFAILVASIGFTALISVRFHESEQVSDANLKSFYCIVIIRVILMESTSLLNMLGNKEKTKTLVRRKAWSRTRLNLKTVKMGRHPLV